MIKAVAKQVPPEEKLYLDPFDYDYIYDDIIVMKNWDYSARYPDKYAKVIEDIKGNAGEELLELYVADGESTDKVAEISDIIRYYFPDLLEGKYDGFCVDVLEVVYNYLHRLTADLDDVLSVLYGKKFIRKCIHGSCQSEWVWIIYEENTLSDKDISRFEKLFFGEFDEYDVEYDDGIEDASYLCYVFDDVRGELAAACGCDPDEIEIYQFSGYKKSPIYTLCE